MFDKEKFKAVLTKIVSGYESILDFSNHLSIDRSYISKYLNMRLDKPPSPAKLKNIADNSKGITTYEELMFICGYIEKQNDDVTYFRSSFNDIKLSKQEFDNVKFYITQKSNVNSDIKDDIFYSLSERELKALSMIRGLQLAGYGLDEIYNNIFNKSNTYRIPVLGKIPAGIPLEMIQDIIDYEDISEDMLKGGKEYFALKINGDSMAPNYLDGDVIIVLKQNNCENGQDAVVAVNGDDATFKRVFKYDNGITLQPLNNQHMPIFYSNEDITTKPVKILGVVKEIRRTV